MSARKAIEGLDASTPFARAAEIVVPRRLDTVRKAAERLEDAVSASEIEAKDVHQVRVAVRRATAALSVFAPVVGKGSGLKKVRRRLRDLRRAIGVVRTCDVSIELVRHDLEAASIPDAPSLDSLRRSIARRRKHALRECVRSLESFSPERLRKWSGRIVESIDARRACPGATLGSEASSRLSLILDRIASYRDISLERDAETLHDLRLVVKRLRYSTEVFGACFHGSDMDETTSMLAELQDRLGAVNDLYELTISAETHAQDADDEDSPGLDALAAAYRTRYESAHASFVSWWRATGERALLESYAKLLEPLKAGPMGGLESSPRPCGGRV